MPIHPVINPALDLIRSLVLGAGLALCCLPRTGQAQSPVETHELNLDQARQLAVLALQSGDPGLAIQVSKGLLKANPRDPFAYSVIAQAHARLNQPNLSRRAAALAYRYSESDEARFQAAQQAARMAYTEGRPTLAQIWLRRTAIHAPSEREEKLVAKDYQALRAINPWFFRLRTDLRPSSNVNNGADTALQTIDGDPTIGTISGDGRALSGLIGTLDISTTYRLQANESSRTSVGARLYVQRVGLSSAARDLAPNAQNSDYSSTYAEISVRRAFAVGEKEAGGSAEIEAALGESWYAQQRNYRFGRASAQRGWRLGQGRTKLTLSAMGELRGKARYGSNDARILGAGAVLSRALSNGDRLGMSLALRNAKTRDSLWFMGNFSSASVRTSYTLGKSVGPAKVSAGLVFGYSDYPVYRVATIAAPGGRQDKSLYGDLSLFFDEYDYAGFAPLLRVRAGRKYSNISRFDTREFSVSLGIESKF